MLNVNVNKLLKTKCGGIEIPYNRYRLFTIENQAQKNFSLSGCHHYFGKIFEKSFVKEMQDLESENYNLFKE